VGFDLLNPNRPIGITNTNRQSKVGVNVHRSPPRGDAPLREFHSERVRLDTIDCI